MTKFTDVVQDRAGNAITGATVTVRIANATPGTGALATIYSDDGVTTIAGSAVTTDVNGRYSFYAVNGRYDITVTGTGITTLIVPDIGEGGEQVSLKSLNGAIFYADQYATGGAGTSGNPWTSASGTGGIQEALNAAGNGGEVYLRPGYFKVTSTISVANPFTLRGAGWNSIIYVDSSMGGSADVLTVTSPSDIVIGFSITNFRIKPVSGTPARYGIHLDGSVGDIQQGIIDHVWIDTLGNFAICADGSGSAQGTPVLTTIQNCLLHGGISMPNIGDTVRILNSNITGPRAAIDVTFQPGASTLIIDGNNITSDGGIHIGASATTVIITRNEIETFGSFTGSNGSLIDIDGANGFVAADTMIQNNSIQVVNGITANGIRMNYATRALIQGNRFGRGATTSKDILITANAAYIEVGNNLWASGVPFSSMVADSGVNTVLATMFNGVFLLNNNITYSQVDEAGTSRPAFGIDSTGTVTSWGYHNRPAFQSVNGRTYFYDSVGAAQSDISFWADPSSVTIPNSRNVLGYSDFGVTQKWSIAGNSGVANFNRYTCSFGSSVVSGDIVLGAGWGSTASISNVVGHDGAFSFKVTANGAGLAANPTLVMTYHDGTWGNSPIAIAAITDTNTSVLAAPVKAITTATTVTVAANIIPGAGDTYTFSVISVGR